MEIHEALFTFVMIGACATACLAFAFLFGNDSWEIFAALGLVYFVFTFIGYLKAYGEHYSEHI